MKANRILLGLMIFISQASFGQALFDWETSYCIENGFELLPSSGQLDNSGNSYYAGNFDTIIDFDAGIGFTQMTPSGSTSGFLMQLDVNGDFVSVIQFGTTSSSGTVQILDFDMNDNGEMIISGGFNGTVDFDPSIGTQFLTSSPSYPFGQSFILKLDASGNLMWVYAWAFGGSVHLDNDGEITVIGLGSSGFGSSTDLDPTPNTQNVFFSTNSRVILKLGANGGYLWHKEIKSTVVGIPPMPLTDVSTDSSGNSYYIGTMNAAQFFDPTGVNYLFEPLIITYSQTNFGKILFKLSDQGDLLWEHLFVDSITVNFEDIEVGPDQNVNVAGWLRGTDIDMDFGIDSALFSSRIWTFFGTSPGTDFYVGKYASNGDFLWGGTFGKEANDVLAGRIAIDSISNYYLTTQYVPDVFGFDIDPGPDTVELIPNLIGRACLVLKLDSAGIFQWAETTHSDLLNASNTYGSHVLPSNISLIDNFILVTGKFDGAVDFDVEQGIIYPDSTCALPGQLYADFMWQLDQCDPLEIIDSVVSCNNYQWIDGNTYYADTSSALFTIETLGQCDTVYRLVFDKLEKPVGIDSVTSCGPYTWFNGTTYAVSTTSPQQIIPLGAINGCDSIANLHLTIIPFDASITQNGVTLEANQSGAQYQWLDCDNNYAVIVGETSQSFIANVNGDYAVEVTSGNCIDTSACFAVTTIGMSELLYGHHVTIFPNPSSESIQLESSVIIRSIEILDSKGRVQFKTKETIIDISKLISGIYLARIQTEHGMTTKRFTKE